MKIHELAKEYDIPAKDFVEKIQNLGIEVKSHSNVLDQSQVDLIRQHLRSEDSDVYTDVNQEIVRPESSSPESGESDSTIIDRSSDLITSEGDAPPTTDTITINLDDLNLDNITDDAQPDFLQQGVDLYQRGDLQGAVRAFEQEVAVNPGNATAYNNLGFMYYQQQRWEESIAACQKAVELKSDYAEAYWNMGFVYEQQGQYLEAVLAVEKGIGFSPGNSGMYSNLGNMYARLERYEDAANAFQNAVLFNPEDAIAYNNLGVARFQTGDFEDAVEAFRRSVEIVPQYEEAKRNLEMALSRVDPLDGLRIEI